MSNPYPYDRNRRVQGPGGDPPSGGGGGGGCGGFLGTVLFIVIGLYLYTQVAQRMGWH